LETSANPLITILGNAAGAERRLNLAQAFNPLGSITGVLIGRQLLLSDTQARSVQSIYLVLGSIILLWALAVALARFPPLQVGAELPEHGAEPPEHGVSGRPADGDFRGLLQHRYFLFGVVAQFAYVGAQVGIWSFLIRYSQHAVSGMNEQAGASCLMAALVAFMVGRFVGTALMGWVRPVFLTSIFAGINVVLCLAGATLMAGRPSR
jgi:FHS family L-fucose permease-like MFS transporter